MSAFSALRAQCNHANAWHPTHDFHLQSVLHKLLNLNNAPGRQGGAEVGGEKACQKEADSKFKIAIYAEFQMHTRDGKFSRKKRQGA